MSKYLLKEKKYISQRISNSQMEIYMYCSLNQRHYSPMYYYKINSYKKEKKRGVPTHKHRGITHAQELQSNPFKIQIKRRDHLNQVFSDSVPKGLSFAICSDLIFNIVNLITKQGQLQVHLLKPNQIKHFY